MNQLNIKPKAPLDIFQKTVQYFPMVAVNIILRNSKGEFLFVKRKNNPAKGLFWTPGGRVLNGERIEEAAHRLLKEETGVEGELNFSSSTFFEEIFPTHDFEGRNWKNYSSETKTVHYLATAVLMELKNQGDIQLDSQSEDYKWQIDLPNNHPYLNNYFDLIKPHL